MPKTPVFTAEARKVQFGQFRKVYLRDFAATVFYGIGFTRLGVMATVLHGFTRLGVMATVLHSCSRFSEYWDKCTGANLRPCRFGWTFFVGKDVARALGYSNTRKALRDHVDEEDKLTRQIVVSGQRREVIFINASGLYALVLSSKLPQARDFRRWGCQANSSSGTGCTHRSGRRRWRGRRRSPSRSRRGRRRRGTAGFPC